MQQIQIALQEYANHDVLGPQNNPDVLKYFKKIGQNWVSDDDTAWCAAFVGYCLETAGVPSTKALNARSYLKWGKSTIDPKIGDIVVFWRISPTSSFGHVSFFIRQLNGVVYCLGGNQSDSVNISAYPLSQVLGFRTVA